MKDRVISIVGNGLPWGLSFFSVAFLLGYFGSNAVATENALKMALAIGACAWIFNGLIYSRFTRPFKQLKDISVEITSPEIVVLEAPANHLTDDSLVGGKLFLTNERIIFKPHSSYKLLPPLFSWSLDDIEPHKFHGTILNAGGEFLVNTKDGFSLMFEVDKLKEWKAALYRTSKRTDDLLANA